MIPPPQGVTGPPNSIIGTHFYICVCNPENQQALKLFTTEFRDPKGILVPRLYELPVSVPKNYSVMLPMKVLSSLSTTGADHALSGFADCWPTAGLLRHCRLWVVCSLRACGPDGWFCVSAFGLFGFSCWCCYLRLFFSASFPLLQSCTHLLTYSFTL